MSTEAIHPPILAYETPAPWRALGRLWHSRGAWALADQAVLSLGNFATNILLVRHLAPGPYGVYALVFNVLLFLNNLHTSLVTYPLTVRGAAGDAADLRRRVERALSLTLLAAPAMTLGLACAAGLVRDWAVLPWAAGAVVAWQLQETVRRGMMARFEHARALPGDALSYLGQAAAVGGLIWLNRLTPATAFAAIGLTSLLAAVVQAAQLGAAPGDRAGLRPAAAECWRMGRWLLLSNVLLIGSIYITPWVLGAVHGPIEVAKYAALMALPGLANPVFAMLGNVVVPAVAAARRAGGEVAARQKAVRLGSRAGLLVAPYFGILLVFPEFVLRLFYGSKSPYLGLGTPLRLFAAAYLIYFVVQAFVAALNGLERTRATLAVTVVGAAGNVLLCVPLAVAYGMGGAAWTGPIPVAAQLVVAVLLFRGGRVPRTALDSLSPVLGGEGGGEGTRAGSGAECPTSPARSPLTLTLSPAYRGEGTGRESQPSSAISEPRGPRP